MKTNKNRLVKWSVQGKIHHPTGGNYRITNDGEPMILPATGGITYNINVGDPAFGWVGDHVEPGVSIRNENTAENAALMTFGCVGNEARVVSGDAKGVKGFVLGSHGGINHTIICFKELDMERMAIDDKIIIKAYGQGLALDDYPEIKVHSIDPELFEKLGIEEVDGKLVVPVAGVIPNHLMGSGVGSQVSASGDYDLITDDMEEIKELGLDTLKFGDLVLMQDADNTYARGHLRGAVTIGVVMHSDCVKGGHGPGITTIMSCKKPLIEGRLDANANVGLYLGFEK